VALTTRVVRLERRAGARRDALCPVCGTPTGWSPVFDVVGEDGRSVMPGCDACGHPFDGGRAVLSLPPGRGRKQFGARVDWRAV